MDMQSMQLVHDLKMPIQLIYSCVQLLEMELSPNARAKGYLQMLLRSADQLQTMVHGALDTPCPSGGEAAPMPIRDVVEDARMVSRQCALAAREKGIRMHFETNAAGFRMPVDGEKLTRMLSNLLSNALRFTSAGGHVSLSVRVLGDSVEFTVSDDGCGIPPEQTETIFRPGVTCGGHGLGLSIVREYAQSLGGDVSVESAPGRGSRFILHLPVLHCA